MKQNRISILIRAAETVSSNLNQTGITSLFHDDGERERERGSERERE